MHKTKTIDYIILLEGDVTLLLDDDEVRLKPFDVVIREVLIMHGLIMGLTRFIHCSAN